MSRAVPKLRFKDFEENWEEYKIGKTLKIKHGKDQKSIIDINGIYPILGTGGEIGRTNTPLYANESVLIGRKGTIDKPMYMNSPFWTVDTLFYSEINNKFNAKFLFYSFQRINWKKYCEASGVPSLSASTIENINYKIPSLPEQEKIANFLTKVDSLIEEQTGKVTDLEKYKKGMMQKIFSQQIRFKDENGCEYPQWEEKKLGDIGFFKTSSIDKLINEDQKLVKLVNYMDVYKHIDLNNNTDLNIVSAKENQINDNNLIKGDILFTPSSETPEDIGHSSVIFDSLINTVYSYHLIRFRPNIKIDIVYSNYFCNVDKVRNQIVKFATGSTRFTVSLKSFDKIAIELPCLEEQTKIGNFLSNIDSIIEEEKGKLEDLRIWKKGLLQQMFV